MQEEYIKNKIVQLETEVENLKIELDNVKKESIQTQFLVLRLIHKIRKDKYINE